MLKAIVFDFDGVIVDSEPLHYQAFLEVGRQLDLTFDYETYLRHYIGFDDRDAVRAMLAQQGLPTDNGRVQALCQVKARAFEAFIRQGIPALPGAAELIHAAAKVMPLAIASGAIRSEIQAIVAGLGLAEQFVCIVAADDVARSKPHPASYQQAVQQLAQARPELDLQPQHCLAIEDTAAGLASARAAGLHTLAVLTTTPREQLQHAHRIVQSLTDIDLPTLQTWYP